MPAAKNPCRLPLSYSGPGALSEKIPNHSPFCNGFLRIKPMAVHAVLLPSWTAPACPVEPADPPARDGRRLAPLSCSLGSRRTPWAFLEWIDGVHEVVSVFLDPLPSVGHIADDSLATLIHGHMLNRHFLFPGTPIPLEGFQLGGKRPRELVQCALRNASQLIPSPQSLFSLFSSARRANGDPVEP